MTGENISEEHLKLLRVLEELTSNDPDGVAQINKAAERIGLDSVGKAADREQSERLVRDLEEVGYVEVRGTDLATSYGQLSVTEEGRRRLEVDG